MGSSKTIATDTVLVNIRVTKQSTKGLAVEWDLQGRVRNKNVQNEIEIERFK